MHTPLPLTYSFYKDLRFMRLSIYETQHSRIKQFVTNQMGKKYFMRLTYCTVRLGQGYCTSLSRQHWDVGVTSHRNPYRFFDVSCCVPVSIQRL